MIRRWLRERARLPLPWPYFTVLLAIIVGLYLVYVTGGGTLVGSTAATPTQHDGGDAERMRE